MHKGIQTLISWASDPHMLEEPPSGAAISSAMSMAILLEKLGVMTETVFPGPSGEIQFDWRMDDCLLRLELDEGVWEARIYKRAVDE